MSSEAVKRLLCGFSVEITPGDSKSLDAAASVLPPGTEVFIASLPKGNLGDVVDAAVRLCGGKLVPVPHLAARNLAGEAQLGEFLARLSGEAGVDRALVIGGDRDDPVGSYDYSLQILKSGLLRKHGVRSVYLSSYPEGHPRIANARLITARAEKLTACVEAGLTAGLVSQFCFETAPIVRMARDLRQQGIHNPLRVGLAGPTGAAVLLKYALVCGVGASIRALRERQSLAKNAIAGDTEGLLAELAGAHAAEPALGIGGVHFFTFGSLSRTADMLARLMNEEYVG
jgi:methylenetetrahydrofolate reductase (NADPH)